jgi:hypothetical protein
VIDGYEYPDKINTYKSLELNPEIKEIQKEVRKDKLQQETYKADYRS